MECLFWDNDGMDIMDDMDAMFHCRSVAYACICGCMILIIKYEKHLPRSQNLIKFNGNTSNQILYKVSIV